MVSTVPPDSMYFRTGVQIAGKIVKRSRYILFFLFYIGLIACRDTAFEVGEAMRFCVPHANLMPEIPWIPENLPASGFAFQASLDSDSQERRLSALGKPSADVLIGAVTVRAAFPQPTIGSRYWRLLTDVRTVHSRILDGRYVLAQHPEEHNFYFIWKPIEQNKTEIYSVNDNLIARCDALPGAHLASKRCHRTTIKFESVFVDYSFDEQLREDVELLDRFVVETVARWRC